jgi:hypothetical protein
MSCIIIKDPAIEPFHISKDQYSYTVFETVSPTGNRPRKESQGKDYEKAVGHFGTLSKALGKIAKSKVDLKPSYDSIKEYIEEYENQLEQINKLLNKIGI